MSKDIIFQTATVDHVTKIVQLLSNDPLGRKRERYEFPLPESYMKAFLAIEEDPNNELIVALCQNDVIGVLQITYTPHLTYQGSWRATIEGVRIASTIRGNGIGREMIDWAICRAKERGCNLVQLTTDKTREDAILFYERIGFRATHEGFKLKI